MSVLEALAHGVPVVATPVGALPDFLSDGNSALLVPVGDAEALAQALAALIRDPALQERLSTGGHAVFRERFDIAKVARRFCVVYHRCGRGLLAAGAWGPET
jgi:glycosyltransferase involved in cell wall biosynthesis